MAGDRREMTPAEKERMREGTKHIGRGYGGPERRGADRPTREMTPAEKARMREGTKDIGRGKQAMAADPYEEWLARNRPDALAQTQRYRGRLAGQVQQANLGERSMLQFSPDPFLLTPEEIAATDPFVMRKMLDEIGRIGETHNFPVTVRNLAQIEAADPGTFAHFQGLPGRQWRLGVPQNLGVDEMERRVQSMQARGKVAGGAYNNPVMLDTGEQFFPQMSGMRSGIETTAAHETGHAIEHGVRRFFEQPAPTHDVRMAQGRWQALQQQLVADAVNRKFAGYSRSYIADQVNPILQDALKHPGMRGHRPFLDLVAKAKAGEVVTPKDIARFDPHWQRNLSQEALAESLAPVFARRTVPMERMLPETFRHMERGHEILDEVNQLRNLGFQGSISPGLAAKGALAFGAPLIAPVIANRLPQGPARSVAQGAISGMGIGGLAGPQGMLIGAGIGAGGALLKQVLG